MLHMESDSHDSNLVIVYAYPELLLSCLLPVHLFVGQGALTKILCCYFVIQNKINEIINQILLIVTKREGMDFP